MKQITLTADSPSRDIFAWNVRRSRVLRQMTLLELGTMIGNSTGVHLSRIERGESAPTLDTVDRLAKALGKTAVELITAPEGGDAS